MDTNEVLGYFKTITKCRPSSQYEVLPGDMLQHVKIHSYPFLACVNIDESSKSGSHWVGVFIGKPGADMEFFDSYGISISNYPPYFKRFAVRNRLTVLESRKVLQGPSSMVCGFYVVMYMYKRIRNCSRLNFYNNFSTNLDANDKFVYNFVKRIFIRKPISCKYFQICKSKIK